MLTAETAPAAARRFLESVGDYPGGHQGRGIVTCAGGATYNTCAWVLIRLLRAMGCQLPIEVWHLGKREADPAWMEVVRPLGVECVDAHETLRTHPHRRLKGWALKPYSILHSRFREVLFLDADNVPVRNPEFLFDAPEYQGAGTVFWPDPEKFFTTADSPLWRIFDTPYCDGPDQESGQLLIDKRRAWRALSLCNWYNEHADFYYQHVYGDKETFRFAWQRVGQPIAWPAAYASEDLPFTLCQHDFAGRVLFQHRFYHKWTLCGVNPRIPGFEHEGLCLDFLEELRGQWSPAERLLQRVDEDARQRMRSLVGRRYTLERVGHNRWPLVLGEDGYVEQGWTKRETFWWLQRGLLFFAGRDGRPTAALRERDNGAWEGRSRLDRRLRLRLTPAPNGDRAVISSDAQAASAHGIS